MTAQVRLREALGHHSFAMFDQNKVGTLTRTIKAVRWANPHVWIDMIVVSPTSETACEIGAGATQTLVRQGGERDTGKPGDKVSLDTHPMRNGSNAGSLMKGHPRQRAGTDVRRPGRTSGVLS